MPTCSGERRAPVPVEARSYALWFALSGIALVLASALALHHEVSARRPWKQYQKDFKRAATEVYTERIEAGSKQRQEEKEGVKIYQNLTAGEAGVRRNAKRAYRTWTRPKRDRVERYYQAAVDHARALGQFQKAGGNEKRRSLTREIRQRQKALREARSVRQRLVGERQSLVWTYETGGGDDLKPGIRELGLKIAPVEEKIEKLETEIESLKQDQRSLVGGVQDAISSLKSFDGPIVNWRRQREEVTSLELSIKQVHNLELGVIDRCETCHAGVGLKGLEELRDPFPSHPDDWFSSHPRETFGCTPCHGGDGFATTTIWEAHGEDPHWHRPLLRGELKQAACFKCHDSRVRLEGAESLMTGRKLVGFLGCVGCHKLRNLGEASSAESSVVREIVGFERRIADIEKRYLKAAEIGDTVTEMQLAPDLRKLKDSLLAQRQQRRRISREMRQVAPDLRKVAIKVKPTWLIPWLTDPRQFRPMTGMPRSWPREDDDRLSRLGKEEVEAVAAFLWQQSEKAVQVDGGVDEASSPQAIERGRELALEVGCLGCHNFTEDDRQKMRERKVLRRFGPDLDRIGEKVHRMWLKDWLLDPRVLQPLAKMPSLRLSADEAEDLTSYLLTLGKSIAAGANIRSQLPRSDLAPRGEAVVKRRGCFGCHQISGMEGEARIGVDLSTHGSKPINEFTWGTQRLQDEFGLPKGGDVWKGWLEAHDRDPDASSLNAMLFQPNHAGRRPLSLKIQFASKLIRPRVFDRGRLIEDDDRSKMPVFNLSPREVSSLVIFLLGLTKEVDHVPGKYRDADSRRARALREGERLLEVHNCRGCHRVQMFPSSRVYREINGKVSRFRESARKLILEERGNRVRRVQEEVRLSQPGLTAVRLDEEVSLRIPPLTEEKLAKGIDQRVFDRWMEHFKAAIRDLEGLVWEFYGEKEKPLAPPVLYPVGPKIKPDWLFKYLKEPVNIRPKHLIRMPNFDLSDREAAALVEYFAATSQEPYPYESDELGEPSLERILEGKRHVEEQKCLECHVPGIPGGDPAKLLSPDMTLVPERIKRRWIPLWTRDPAEYQPGVDMSSYDEVFKEKTEEICDRIADYLVYQERLKD